MRVGALSLGALAIGLLAMGCADSESMIFIRQVQARLPSGSTSCTADNAPTSPALGEGVLDVAFRTRYTAALLVGNQLVPRGNSSELRTETSRVAIQGSIVRVLDDAGNLAWGPVTVPGTGFIEPASSATPSFGLTESTLFQADQAVMNDLASNGGLRRDLAIVKVFGRTLGGTTVESGEWQFPINICFRCLISFPAEASTSTTMPNCLQAASTGTAVTPPCNPGQDDTLDCRACKEIFTDPRMCEP
jgi:hypothetical protein